MIYLQNYGVFMNNVLSSKMRYITAIIMVTIVGLIAFAILAKYIRDEQHLFIKIIKIYYWLSLDLYQLSYFRYLSA